MPRSRGKYRAYSWESLEAAVLKVRNKECSMRRASLDYGIPRTTLIDKLSGRSPLFTTQGPSPVLTTAEEKKLAEWLKNMSRIGYGQTRQQLRMMVKKILDEDGRQNPFTNNTPGNDWFRRFKRRHPGLSERLGESLGKERAMLTVQKLEAWYVELENYLTEEEGGLDIMDDPSRMFNCDESGFPLNGKTMKVLAPTGCKTVYQLTNSDKSQITVLACMNAAGIYVPPMLIFPGQRFKYNPLRGAPDNWFLGRSESGWIDQEVFFEWIANHFVPVLKQANIKFPVILFMDGHRSHINLETANFCSENKVILFCFPAHASHILQPCDLSLFKSVKTYWKKEVQQWQIDNPGQNVTKQTFACIFYKAWRQSAMPKIAANGFRAAGLYPFTKEFDKAKVAPSEIFRSQEIARIADYDMPILSPVGEFSEEATSPHQQPDNRVRVPVPGVNNVAATMARKALEGTFTPEKIWVFERRLREGFDIETDELFNTWKKLKLQETNKDSETVPPAAVPVIPYSPTRRPVLTSTYVSPSLDKHLRYPKAPESRRPAKATKQLPKAISGKKYRQYLEDKLSAKAELERTRREKKVIREARKVEKIRLQKERAKRLEEAKKKSRVKRPVCRKLMSDLPERAEKTASGRNDARVVHTSVTSVGTDQQQTVANEVMDEEEQGIETALEEGPALSTPPDRSEDGPELSKPPDGSEDGPALSTPPDRSEDGPALSKPPDGSPVIANTLVQLGLDDSLKFPSQPSTSETPESLEMPSLEQMEVLPTLATDELLPDGEEAELLSNMKEALAIVNETWEEQPTEDVVLELGDDIGIGEGERPATDGEGTCLSKDGDLPIEVEVGEQPPSAAEAPGALAGVLIASNEDGEGTSNLVEPERTEETDTRPMGKKIKLKFMKKSGKKKSYYEEDPTGQTKGKGQEDDWALVDENICDICEQCYRDDDNDWVGCEWCPRWFHKGCTDIADIHDMSEREIHSVEWFCHHCM